MVEKERNKEELGTWVSRSEEEMEELVGEDCGATNSPPGSNMLMVHALYSSQFHTQKWMVKKREDIKDSQVIVRHWVSFTS